MVAGAVAAAADRPNLVFFFADDQAYDTLGCYGNPDVRTPRIDALAARGVCFDRHYNSTSICMASRASVMTGLYEYRTGCNFSHGPLVRALWERSYPVRLRAAGYRTAFGGKFGFAVVDQPGDKGSEGRYEDLPMADFDFWVGGTGQTSFDTAKNKYLARFAKDYPHSSRAYGAAGAEFVRESVAASKPFCLSVFFKAPHKPAQPDPAFDAVYKDTHFRKLPNYGRAAGEHLAPQHKLGRQYPRFEQWGYDKDETYQRELRLYHQQIHGIDAAVGMVMDELERRGVAGDTVVIYSSDNGYFNGSHGLGSKVLPYEEGARVPLIVSDPQAPGQHGTRRGAVTGNIDIPATLLDYAGLDADGMDGRSLRPVVEGRAERAREALTLVQVWGPVGTYSLGVVNESHKYIHWPYAEGMEASEELFDLGSDPYELRNVVEDPDQAGALAVMRRAYAEALAHWRSEGVDHNGYAGLDTFFDPEVPWAKKKRAAQPERPEKKRPKRSKR